MNQVQQSTLKIAVMIKMGLFIFEGEQTLKIFDKAMSQTIGPAAIIIGRHFALIKNKAMTEPMMMRLLITMMTLIVIGMLKLAGFVN